MIIGLLHWLTLLFPIFYVAVGGSPKNYELIVCCLVFISIHWAFFSDECILSYIGKKHADCNYEMGKDIYNISDLDINGSNVPALITGFMAVAAGGVMVSKLGLNLPLYLFVTIAPRVIYRMNLNQLTILRNFITPLASIYLLRDNKYLLPGLIILLGSTAIVHHKDQNGCIRK